MMKMFSHSIFVNLNNEPAKGTSESGKVLGFYEYV